MRRVRTAALSDCSACGKSTKTILGRCPNCGAVKDGALIPATRPGPRGDFWGELDWIAVLAGPGVVLTLVALFVVASDLLLLVGLGAILLPLLLWFASHLGY
jgi:hypothetical protein